MDLGAYVQIEDIEPIVKANNIEVNRVRGYRLMKEQEPMSIESINDDIDYLVAEYFRDKLRSFIEYGLVFRHDDISNKQKKKYFIYKDEYDFTVNWSNIHGKRRKDLKFMKKIISKQIKEQYNLWNKYCNQDNILYIHAKQGRTNWSDTWRKDYEDKEWYLDSVDDSYDPCYCDIYAKLKPAE